MRRVFPALCLALLLGCQVSGEVADDPPTYDGAVDLVFIQDNSSSMADSTAAFGAAVGSFLDSEAGLDLQVMATSTDVSASLNGTGGNLRSLQVVGAPPGCFAPHVSTTGDATFETDVETLVTTGVAGSGAESGLLAAALTLCKSQDSAFWSDLAGLSPDAPLRAVCELVDVAERDTGNGPPCNAVNGTPVFREEARTLFVIRSDEGDSVADGDLLPPAGYLASCPADDCDCRISFFQEFFASPVFGDVRIATISPSYQLVGETSQLCGSDQAIPGPCNLMGSSRCSLDLYQTVACSSGGGYEPFAKNLGGIDASNPPQCEETTAAELALFTLTQVEAP